MEENDLNLRTNSAGESFLKHRNGENKYFNVHFNHTSIERRYLSHPGAIKTHLAAARVLRCVFHSEALLTKNA